MKKYIFYSKKEGIEIPFIGEILFMLFGLSYKTVKKRFLVNLVIKIILYLEGGECHSITLRRIFSHYLKVDVGLYSIGGCFNIFNIHPYTTVGRYCSIASTACVFNRNHPLEFKSTHAYFFNPLFGYCKNDLIEFIPLKIGHDVWIGHNAIIMPIVKEIGTGSVIAAGAVVNKDIPPYAIVAGNPARIVRYRFSPETIQKLLASRWWEKSIEEIAPNMDEYTRPFETIQMAKEEKSD